MHDIRVYGLYDMLMLMQNGNFFVNVFVYMWSICGSLIMMFFKKVTLNLYLFMNLCSADDSTIFVDKFILKSPIITIIKFENIFYKRSSRI